MILFSFLADAKDQVNKPRLQTDSQKPVVLEVQINQKLNLICQRELNPGEKIEVSAKDFVRILSNPLNNKIYASTMVIERVAYLLKKQKSFAEIEDLKPLNSMTMLEKNFNELLEEHDRSNRDYFKGSEVILSIKDIEFDSEQRELYRKVFAAYEMFRKEVNHHLNRNSNLRTYLACISSTVLDLISVMEELNNYANINKVENIAIRLNEAISFLKGFYVTDFNTSHRDCNNSKLSIH